MMLADKSQVFILFLQFIPTTKMNYVIFIFQIVIVPMYVNAK